MAVGVGFVILAGAFMQAAGFGDRWVLRWQYAVFTGAWLSVSAAGLGFVAVFNARRRSISAGQLIGAMVVLVFAPPFQSTFNSMKRIIPFVVGFRWDAELASLDRMLHGGNDPWRWMRPVIESREAIRILDLCYSLWFVFLLLFLVWAAWSVHTRLRIQALTTAALVWIVCGSILAFAFSSAGPCYFSFVVPGDRGETFGDLLAILDVHRASGLPVLARMNQAALWRSYQEQYWLVFGGISAMPSVHVAMATLFALTAWSRHQFAGILLVFYALAIQIGSVALGWHYAVDGYVGATVTVGLWKLVGRLDSIRRLPISLDDKTGALPCHEQRLS